MTLTNYVLGLILSASAPEATMPAEPVPIVQAEDQISGLVKKVKSYVESNGVKGDFNGYDITYKTSEAGTIKIYLVKDQLFLANIRYGEKVFIGDANADGKIDRYTLNQNGFDLDKLILEATGFGEPAGLQPGSDPKAEEAYRTNLIAFLQKNGL